MPVHYIASQKFQQKDLEILHLACDWLTTARVSCAHTPELILDPFYLPSGIIIINIITIIFFVSARDYIITFEYNFLIPIFIFLIFFNDLFEVIPSSKYNYELFHTKQ